MISGNTLVRAVKGIVSVEDLQEGDEVYSSIIDPLATAKVKSVNKVSVDSIGVLKLKFGEFLEFHESSKILSEVIDGKYNFLDLNKVPECIAVSYDNTCKLDKYPIRYCCNNNLLFQEQVYNIELENTTENTFLQIKFKNSNITLYIK